MTKQKELYDDLTKSNREERFGRAPVLHSASYPWRVDVGQAPGDLENDPGRTRLDMQDECDVNLIMARYERAGGMFPQHLRQPMYLDMTTTPDDLMTAMSQMREAETAFMTLPAHVRKEFDNDPMKFVEFASDTDKNLPKLREWGLAAPEPIAEKPIQVEVINPNPEPTKP